VTAANADAYLDYLRGTSVAETPVIPGDRSTLVFSGAVTITGEDGDKLNLDA
jgi:hypothetical protein